MSFYNFLNVSEIILDIRKIFILNYEVYLCKVVFCFVFWGFLKVGELISRLFKGYDFRFLC